MKGKIDTNAVMGGKDEPTFSDAEISELIEQEQEVLIAVVDKNKTRSGGAFFNCLNNTLFDFDKYGIFKTIDRLNYKHNCLYLALEAGGLSDIKLQQLMLTLRNRAVHKCNLSNVCDALEIHIELISLRDDGTCRVEHYGKDYEETYNVGLVINH